MEYLRQLIFTLLMALVARELVGQLSRFSHWLVRKAAQRLPAEERERFIDENLADIEAIEGPLSKLYNALGCFGAAASLIEEHAIASDDLNPVNSPHGSADRLLAIPLLAPPRVFVRGQRIKFADWPCRTARVHRFLPPPEAARAFPHGVRGAAKPPYVDGVVKATFEDLDPNDNAWPNEVAAGTCVDLV